MTKSLTAHLFPREFMSARIVAGFCIREFGTGESGVYGEDTFRHTRVAVRVGGGHLL